MVGTLETIALLRSTCPSLSLRGDHCASPEHLSPLTTPGATIALFRSTCPPRHNPWGDHCASPEHLFPTGSLLGRPLSSFGALVPLWPPLGRPLRSFGAFVPLGVTPRATAALLRSACPHSKLLPPCLFSLTYNCHTSAPPESHAIYHHPRRRITFRPQLTTSPPTHTRARRLLHIMDLLPPITHQPIHRPRIARRKPPTRHHPRPQPMSL